ncbi:MAG: hemerythrin family protein [Firmicutes bacterium]|nr:hemerythrin family protein [Bacillota bacterium]
MIWKDSYALGVDALDRQHRELFEAVNLLSSSLEKSDQESCKMACIDALTYLENYTIVHFGDEEEYQRSIGYINYLQHKRQHDAFLKTISYMKYELMESKFSRAAIKRFSGTLTSWLVYHVTNSDQDIVGKRKGYSQAGSMSRILQNVMIKAIDDMFHISPEVADDNYMGDFSEGDLLCLVDINDDTLRQGYRFIFALEELFALRTVGSLIGKKLDAVDELVASAIGELSNIFSLQVLSLFHNNGEFKEKQVKMIPPSEIAKYSLPREPESSILFSSDMGSFSIRAWKR